MRKGIGYVAWSVLAAVVVTLLAGGVFWLKGWRLYAVQTGSMTPTHPTGSLVVDAPMASEGVRVGDVVTFRTPAGPVTHRVQEVVADGVRTKGDANRTPDPWLLRPQHVVGRVVLGVQGAGYVLVFLQQPTGVPSLMALTLSVVFAWTLFFPAGRGDPVVTARRCATR